MYYINFFKVVRNKDFTFFISAYRKYIVEILLLSLFSTAVVVAFPLITQLYIAYVYRQQTLDILFWITLGTFILYVVKLVADIRLKKNLVIFYENLEAKIKTQMWSKYKDKTNLLLKDKNNLYTKYLGLYIALVRTIYFNFVDAVRILSSIVIIFFYDIQLFMYFSLALPVLLLFYFMYQKQIRKEQQNISAEKDFGILVQKAIITNDPDRMIDTNIANHVKKNIANKTQFNRLDQTMQSFVSFYRLFYLAYFGILTIRGNIMIEGLIVGLLYITILMRPCIRLIESQKYYYIGKVAFFKINGLLK